MFALPQPDTLSNVDEHDLPVIDLEEDSCTLGHVLSLCHPPGCTGRQFKVNGVHELRAVLQATVKYDMENAHCAALEELSNPSILREDPVVTYALACQYKHHEAARSAAKHTLALPVLLRGYVPDLEKIHAGRLCNLLLYREACKTAASSLAVDHTWIQYTNFLALFRCNGDEELEWTMIRNPPSRKYRRGRVEYKSVHKWWLEYMRGSEYALQRWPHSDAVKDQKLVDEVLTAISNLKCDQCKESKVEGAFQSFVHIFAENVERCVAEVEITLGF